jgi:GT2 family glycosyltransferase
MNKLKVSIIIPIHNQFNLLDLCLKSIDIKTDKEKYDYEIILSDSNSNSYDKEYYNLLELSSLSFKNNIKITQDNKDPGFSRAINNGMKIARQDSDYYIWLNSDTFVTKNWLDRIQFYDLCSPISNSASYQTFLPIDIDEIELVEKFLKYNIDICEKLVGDHKHKNSIYDIKTPFLNGFCYIISKNVFQTIGYLDEIHFPHYGSEDDYSIKAYLKGFKAYILCHNFVYHKGNSSYREQPNSLKKQQARNLLNRYPKDWLDQQLQIHKFKTRISRQQLTERFMDYVQEISIKK